MLRVGIWGCGGISAMHRRGYQLLKEQGVPVEVVALCDINPSNFNNEIKINVSKSSDAPLKKIDHCYTDIEEMIAKENLDLIDICLPTFLHKDATIKVLDSGINVLVEKPMAMSSEECREMLEAEKRSGKRLMVGHCVRFNKAYTMMREAIQSGEYGKLITADFARLSAVPLWRMHKGGPNKGRLDGVILDMHIHDVDIIRYLFGEPSAVCGRGSSPFSLYDAIHASLYYNSVPVTAIADWTRVGVPFSAGCSINFEKATILFDGRTLTVAHKEDGRNEIIPLSDESGYLGEISYFCDVLEGKTQNTKNPAHSAATSVRLVGEIRKSADESGSIVKIAWN